MTINKIETRYKHIKKEMSKISKQQKKLMKDISQFHTRTIETRLKIENRDKKQIRKLK